MTVHRTIAPKLWILASLLGLGFLQPLRAQTGLSPAGARRWLDSGAWRQGLPFRPEAQVNALRMEIQYRKNPELWNRVFQFLRNSDLAHMAPGSYPIEGKQAYASITDEPNLPLGKTRWESHRAFIDLQMMIRGSQRIGEAPVGNLKVLEPYSAARDVAHYSGPGRYYTARPGSFFVFFPGEGHRTNIRIGTDAAPVKKLVIKIANQP